MVLSYMVIVMIIIASSMTGTRWCVCSITERMSSISVGIWIIGPWQRMGFIFIGRQDRRIRGARTREDLVVSLLLCQAPGVTVYDIAGIYEETEIDKKKMEGTRKGHGDIQATTTVGTRLDTQMAHSGVFSRESALHKLIFTASLEPPMQRSLASSSWRNR